MDRKFRQLYFTTRTLALSNEKAFSLGDLQIQSSLIGVAWLVNIAAVAAEQLQDHGLSKADSEKAGKILKETFVKLHELNHEVLENAAKD